MYVIRSERPRWAVFVDLFFRPSEQLLSNFLRLGKSRWPLLWVAGLFLVQAIPATLIRASNLEEGRIIAIARGAVENGYWLTPHIYGDRFVERPVLLSWIAAAFGEISGSVGLWSLRLPHLCFFFIGALLIYQMLRHQVGKAASIFAVLCWLCMPMVAAKFINAEPDIVLSVLLFAAFTVWWQSASPLRWIGVAALLCLAGFTKGPQPVAYFTLGVGTYLLLKQRSEIPAFLLANAAAGGIIGAWYLSIFSPSDGDAHLWLEHSRVLTEARADWIRDHLDFLKSIAIESLPATILVGPAVPLVAKRWRAEEPDLLLASVLYALACTLVLVVWPGGVASRYAMPATPALAVACGLIFESWREERRRMIAGTLFICYLIFGGLILRGWVAMPIWPHLFQGSKIAGAAVAQQMRGRTLYVLGASTELNILVYVKKPIRAVTIDDLARPNMNVTAILLPEEIAQLEQKSPSLRINAKTIPGQKQPYELVEISP